ncbi:HIT family protein [Pseudokineococcus basanitobsidens]|uniref:HIT family protein n=1 Tax=Pseudokineococcus basanitobsidens TaxID=1926649 RepID=A0ABU8RGJ3_9ACTN
MGKGARTGTGRHDPSTPDDGGAVPQAFSPRGSDAPCAFCAVVRGDAPADVVHRGERLLAFLDAHPLFPGHVLLAPVVHVPTYDELPADLAREWLVTGQALQRAVEAATGAEGALLLVNNVVSQSVPHLHQHVVPRSRGDGLRFFLGPRHRYAEGEAAEVAARIRERMAHRAPG